MTQVPPADRTSPLLDPRYDPAFQRGYSAGTDTASGAASPVRRREGRTHVPAPVLQQVESSPFALLEGADEHQFSRSEEPVAGGGTTSAQERTAPAATQVPASPWPARFVPILFALAGALVLAGIVFHFVTGPDRYAQYSYAFTASADGGVRFENGKTLQEVLTADLLSSLAPYLIVLGLATAVATVFLIAVRAGRQSR
jgi:hypothetical protein